MSADKKNKIIPKYQRRRGQRSLDVSGADIYRGVIDVNQVYRPFSMQSATP